MEQQQITSFRVESHWNYAADERYNSGRGLASSGMTESHARDLFARLSEPGYSVDLCCGETVVAHFGPPTAEAIRSMNRAWHRRRTEAETFAEADYLTRSAERRMGC